MSEELVELDGIDELTAQVSNLKKRLDTLVKMTIEDEEREPPCICWTLYEQQIGQDPLEFMRKHMDKEEATLERLKEYKLKDLAGCLRFFKGDIRQKKRKFFEFVKRASGYRTINLKLLEQRLYITKKWMKENNINRSMEELPELLNSSK